MKKILFTIISLCALTSCGAKGIDNTPSAIEKIDLIDASFENLSVIYDGNPHILTEINNALK